MSHLRLLQHLNARNEDTERDLNLNCPEILREVWLRPEFLRMIWLHVKHWLSVFLELVTKSNVSILIALLS
ncbi:Uncharacterized protein BM_BM17520 [Brugia malayi]|uniref:Uncharacterized protein n=1 Tax=Brugia malayi TaxID=6279 RepID=A0A4E9FBR7_BRUMA|nr:Uncharacterized protein BM_BM17520 [Brugia malayi]VIO94237.1 Uncharacterized protein BM_BM17520 [Brugia malayi]